MKADGVGEEMEQTDNRMKNMGIMFLFIGVAISLIAGAVFIRRRIEKNNASEEEQNQSKEATKNHKWITSASGDYHLVHLKSKIKK